MIPHNHGLRLLLLFLLFVTVSSASLSDFCSESQCGDITIKYPFYLTNPSPASQQPSSFLCGYRGFGVECNRTTNTPMFKLSGDSYVVKEINTNTSHLRLVDAEISSLDCPKPEHNVTLSDTAPLLKLNFAATNFSFLIDCPYYPFLVPAPSSPNYPKLSTGGIVNPIKCLNTPTANSNRVKYSYAVSPFSVTIHANRASQCNRYVIVPYSGNQPNGVPPGSFPSVVKEGFVLEWVKEKTCFDCENSGGRCGYYTISVQNPRPVCFCGDGTASDQVCKDKEKKDLFLPSIPNA